MWQTKLIPVVILIQNQQKLINDPILSLSLLFEQNIPKQYQQFIWFAFWVESLSLFCHICWIVVVLQRLYPIISCSKTTGVRLHLSSLITTLDLPTLTSHWMMLTVNFALIPRPLVKIGEYRRGSVNQGRHGLNSQVGRYFVILNQC